MQTCNVSFILFHFKDIGHSNYNTHHFKCAFILQILSGTFFYLKKNFPLNETNTYVNKCNCLSKKFIIEVTGKEFTYARS